MSAVVKILKEEKGPNESYLYTFQYTDGTKGTSNSFRRFTKGEVYSHSEIDKEQDKFVDYIRKLLLR